MTQANHNKYTNNTNMKNFFSHILTNALINHIKIKKSKNTCNNHVES